MRQSLMGFLPKHSSKGILVLHCDEESSPALLLLREALDPDEGEEGMSGILSLQDYYVISDEEGNLVLEVEYNKVYHRVKESPANFCDSEGENER